MAWEDLDSELSELFGEYATSAEKVEAALYIKGQWQSAAAQAYLQEWRSRNRAHINGYLREWRARNRDKVNAYRRTWRERHLEERRAKEREDRALRMQDPEYAARKRAYDVARQSTEAYRAVERVRRAERLVCPERRAKKRESDRASKARKRAAKRETSCSV